MSMNFPTSPTLNQTYTFGSKTWVWNGYAWDAQDVEVVVGPSSATDNALARFDGTTGKLIQAAQALLDDDGRLTNITIDSITNSVGADHIHFKVKATQALVPGNVVKIVGYNSGENAYEVAKISSASDVAVGLCHDTLSTGSFGAIVNTGLLEGFDTSAFAVGTILYPNTNGGLTSTKPSSGTYQALAFVLRSHATNGAVLIEASEPAYVQTSSATGNTAVLRDASGNFTANVITSGILPRVVSITSASTITPTSDTADQYQVTALATAATIAAPSGTPVNGQKLVLRLKDDGTSRALTWTTGSNGAFRAVGVTLPTTTTANKTTYVGCVYNSADLRWDVIASATEA